MGSAVASNVLLPRLLFRPLLSILRPIPIPCPASSPRPPLPLLRSSRLISTSLRPLLPSPSSLPPQHLQFHETTEDDDAPQLDGDVPQLDAESEAPEAARVLEFETLPVPVLTVKEKKELASYAHSLGDKLKTQQVGKSGVSPNTAMAFIETLESNELLKVKIHRTCPGEIDDVVKELESRTGSVSVGQIGRMVIFYRPSASKLKAVEKKKLARKIFMDRKLRSTTAAAVPGRERERGPREHERSRSGSSRFSSSRYSSQSSTRSEQ